MHLQVCAGSSKLSMSISRYLEPRGGTEESSNFRLLVALSLHTILSSVTCVSGETVQSWARKIKRTTGDLCVPRSELNYNTGNLSWRDHRQHAPVLSCPGNYLELILRFAAHVLDWLDPLFHDTSSFVLLYTYDISRRGCSKETPSCTVTLP